MFAFFCIHTGDSILECRLSRVVDDLVCRFFVTANTLHEGRLVVFQQDVKALIKTADKAGYSMEVLKAVERVNERQKHVLFNKLVKAYGDEKELKGKTIALWGLSFKPETDDMRESTALVIIDSLLKAGCNIRAYDPVAMDECKRRLPDAPITYCRDMYDAVLDADAMLLLTEWKEFRLPTWADSDLR